ncbi:MAG: hypothetical protein OEN48_03135 [Betaproteobacteria bacterium]|nr:hypothetical protein [Gammaproteobacteria bacterium]MDH3435969.1 hypothetical protein [Betaproteobacteria bacterium]
MNARLVAAILLALPLFVAAGCGEQQAVTVFKQGTYQGKPDARPWDSADFKGDKAEWERAINTRMTGQNEYVRIKGG